MTLFPWPGADGSPAAHRDILWSRPESGLQALLIDTPAVPLCFAPTLAPDVAAAAPQAAAQPAAAADAARLLVTRDFRLR